MHQLNLQKSQNIISSESMCIGYIPMEQTHSTTSYNTNWNPLMLSKSEACILTKIMYVSFGGNVIYVSKSFLQMKVMALFPFLVHECAKFVESNLWVFLYWRLLCVSGYLTFHLIETCQNTILQKLDQDFPDIALPHPL